MHTYIHTYIPEQISGQTSGHSYYPDSDSSSGSGSYIDILICYFLSIFPRNSILSYPSLSYPLLSYPILLSPISPCCLSFWFDLFLLPYFTFPHLFHFLFLFFCSVLMTSLINQVLMIVVTYSWVAPLLMPMGSLFFCHSYLMYKYQLLYVYINKDQSGGFMW